MQLKKITAIVGVFISISTLAGVIITFDKRWAHAEDLAKLEQRLDYKICIDRKNSIQDRLWKLEDRYGVFENMNQSTKEEYRELDQKKDELNCDQIVFVPSNFLKFS